MTTTPARNVLQHADRVKAILDFWFGDADKPVGNYELWFGGGPDIDGRIRDLFAEDVERARSGAYLSWLSEPQASLALCIVLDQFPLNIYRDQPLSFETSASAIPFAYTAIGRGFHLQLPEVTRMFMYLPLMHSEHLADQLKCCELMAGDSFATEHRDIVQKYGRFPGRNVVMGRESTPEEVAYLAAGGAF